MKKRCVFLTTSDLEDFHVYDNLVLEPLANYGWQVDEIPWKQTDVNWDQYDLVVIRSTWDYQEQPEAFTQSLQQIEASKAELQNSLALVEWNINKGYLKDLSSRHVPIVPTIWQDTFNSQCILDSFTHFDATEIIIKPLVSANADFTYRLDKRTFSALESELSQVFDSRAFMIQPFLNAVIDEGEYSLFYFSGKYSHCILKQPASGDFRVQEEHGGRLTSVKANKELRAHGDKTLSALPECPLYARIDLIRTAEGLALMEVELIEPSLYFNMDKKSAQRFANAIEKRFG